ncbi:MAG: transcription antitermination factor NusB [Gammaproteobacteria bacterium]|nr:transcription antitermination factor NusB [Gammaproteobacteria bacterium]MXY04984.1 transcription antitermination factor NusB [Gammaproteobacteria bacterium]MYE51587.1 transcription antitermination factor NusB [Gammaproteobacteria bacterium]MYE85257.1 transcription antitermination factor NusB [Gammaproteobacteria bacterium]MYF50210.1 transcription antitermination factor NusB [Gammaproteobacteria bacterium]
MAEQRRRGAPGVNVSQRRKARRVLVQALYQWQMNRTTARLLTAEYTGSGALDKADRPFFDAMLGRVLASPSQLDELFGDLLDRDQERLDGVELAILRLGACELRHRPDVPARVVIDEYIELAKLFGAEASHKYVNGVLDKLAGSLRPTEMGRDA